MPEPKVQILLARHAETAWQAVIRPWLAVSQAGLTRSQVVVPTRGQAHGLKQRCVAENLPLLGVEFLSPGLARQKWLPLAGSGPALGRELLLFELRVAIAGQLACLTAEDPKRGLLKSLLSDAERAFDDFDELLKAGRTAHDFADPILREVFAEVALRVERLGYVLGSSQSRTVALEGFKNPIVFARGRLLIYGLGPEAWGEFFNVAAFARCFEDVTIVLPEPEFSGRRTLDEDWVALWEKFLGVEALPLDEAAPAESCEHVAAWWGGAGLAETPSDGSRPPEVLVGRTRGEEMDLVADKVVRLLAGGASEIAVIFPKAEAAVGRLAGLLTQRGVPFINLLPCKAAAPLEARLQRALIAFYAQGGRLDELLSLWPLLQATGQTELSLLQARGICERLFDEQLTHSLTACVPLFEGRDRPEWKEMARVVGLLLPVWPDELTLRQALESFQSVCSKLDLPNPPGWQALVNFAERESRLLPAREIFILIDSFLPKDSMVVGSANAVAYARVTLTSRRRAEGLAWSHVIFTGSNAGIWPQRQSSSGWLTDEQRLALAKSNPSLPAPPTADDRAWMERRGYAALARDAREQVVFSAALTDEAQPELPLAPNAWLERVLWHNGIKGGDLPAAFERLASRVSVKPNPSERTKIWRAVWEGRREQSRPFDEFFFSVDPGKLRPQRVAVRTLEAAVADPAVLWYEAVLGCACLDHGPLLRSAPRALGQLIHRVVAKALRGGHREGVFFARPERSQVEQRLAEELQRLRGLWPANRFWDSFHASLAQGAEAVMEGVLDLEGGSLMATERRLPEGVVLPLGGAESISVSGRMDLIMADRETWPGAVVDIVDFKTGSDNALSAKRMGLTGESLQLGIYLAAARSLGAQSGRVWMVKPDGVSSLAMDELDLGLAPLAEIGRHLATGRYGALTPDQNKYEVSGAPRPLACTPIPVSILQKKFAATFGVEAASEGDAIDE
ncbi:MAG: PD-(D/E)XK nuclease family protein [Nibricoccus sp.]